MRHHRAAAVLRRLQAPRSRRTAFVLGGGGNLGAAQVGALSVLLERGVRPDLIVGCSVGAINGAALATDPTAAGVARMAEVWRRLGEGDVFPGVGLLRLHRLAVRRPGLCSSDRLRSLLGDHLPASFDDLRTPLEVVATSLRTGEERWFGAGPLVDAVLASAAMPGMFPPVELDDDRLVDGGVVNNDPVDRAVALGARTVFVFHLGGPGPDLEGVRRPLDVIRRSYSMARDRRFQSQVNAVADRAEVIVVPTACAGLKLRPNDLSRSTELIDRAATATRAFFDDGRLATPA